MTVQSGWFWAKPKFFIKFSGVAALNCDGAALIGKTLVSQWFGRRDVVNPLKHGGLFPAGR